jgi:hypothetical protein
VGRLFPAPVVTDYGGAFPLLISLGVTALLLVALTRGHLGYRNYRQGDPYPATTQPERASVPLGPVRQFPSEVLRSSLENLVSSPFGGRVPSRSGVCWAVRNRGGALTPIFPAPQRREW